MEIKRDYSRILHLIDEMKKEPTKWLHVDMYCKKEWGDNEPLYDSYVEFFLKHDFAKSMTNYRQGLMLNQSGIDVDKREIRKLIKYGSIDERLAKYQEKEYKRRAIYGLIGFSAGAILTNLKYIWCLMKQWLHL